MLNSFRCLLLWLGLAATLSALPASLARAAAPSAALLTSQLDLLAQKVVQLGRIPGLAMVIVVEGEVVWVEGYGVTQVGSREKIDADTAFRLASLSKGFAGAVCGLLVQEGALRWDTRVTDPIPGFQLNAPGAAQQVTLRDVLSHRVGLPFHTYDRDLEANKPYPVLAAKLGEAPLRCQPGACYAYQNVAFGLVSDLVFAATGDFYTHQVESRIFHPLGMHNATFGRDGLESSRRWARPHVRGKRGWMAVRPKETYYRVPPAAGVNATARDMGAWIRAQLGMAPEVLDADLIADLQRPQIATPTELRRNGWRGTRIKSAQYATGWRIFDYAGHELVFHAGAVQGYRAMLGMLPDKKFGMAVLWNSESSAPGGMLAVALDRVLGLPSRDWTGFEKTPLRGRR
ncbi:MAG: beta-lactamase family protein [Xanthomonadales bacterium]|nr:beta-lactamase family protein [Xanthomonadales bacterium]